MHSIWQEKIEFPRYPILTCDHKTDILYEGVTLAHGVEAYFQKKKGYGVMIIEKKFIAQMPELGGMGILRARNNKEQVKLDKIREEIEGKHIPCDLEVVSPQCLQVHPVKLFLWMTKELQVFEQTGIASQQGKRVDVGLAYIDAAKVMRKKPKQEPRYIHVFSREEDIPRGDYLAKRTYGKRWLVMSTHRRIPGNMFSWEL